jgi:hypothetical protein
MGHSGLVERHSHAFAVLYDPEPGGDFPRAIHDRIAPKTGKISFGCGLAQSRRTKQKYKTQHPQDPFQAVHPFTSILDHTSDGNGEPN